jgi:hypothetical protein
MLPDSFPSEKFFTSSCLFDILSFPSVYSFGSSFIDRGRRAFTGPGPKKLKKEVNPGTKKSFETCICRWLDKEAERFQKNERR